MFSVGIIEGIFGLSLDKIRNVFTFSPCFPEEWDKAEIALKGIRISYEKRDGKHLFFGTVKNTANKRFLWRVPPYSKVCVHLEGKSAEALTRKRCGYFETEIELGTDEQFCLEISYVPIAFEVEAAKSIAEGDAFSLKISGAEFLSVHDPCGVFDTVEKRSGGAWCSVCGDLLKPYEKFGWFGRINFARRTFFVNLRADEVEFRVPVHITVLPRYALKAELNGENIVISGRRYKENCDEKAVLIFAGESSFGNMNKGGKKSSSFFA
ncbi:MAG: hypothetical protein KH354_07395 [Clostridiales bacterium]|nr:hypothetical protein [Clostridiales bacterium]